MPVSQDVGRAVIIRPERHALPDPVRPISALRLMLDGFLFLAGLLLVAWSPADSTAFIHFALGLASAGTGAWLGFRELCRS